MDTEQTWNFISGMYFIIQDTNQYLNEHTNKYIIDGNYIRLLRFSNIDTNLLIAKYNLYMDENCNGKFKVSDHTNVVKNIYNLIMIDQLSDDEIEFKTWLSHIFSDDERMFLHLYDKWYKYYDKNITLWYGGLDPINKRKVINSNCNNLDHKL